MLGSASRPAIALATTLIKGPSPRLEMSDAAATTDIRHPATSACRSESTAPGAEMISCTKDSAWHAKRRRWGGSGIPARAGQATDAPAHTETVMLRQISMMNYGESIDMGLLPLQTQGQQFSMVNYREGRRGSRPALS
jgi:hypothetical protein